MSLTSTECSIPCAHLKASRESSGGDNVPRYGVSSLAPIQSQYSPSHACITAYRPGLPTLKSPVSFTSSLLPLSHCRPSTTPSVWHGVIRKVKDIFSRNDEIWCIGEENTDLVGERNSARKEDWSFAVKNWYPFTNVPSQPVLWHSTLLNDSRRHLTPHSFILVILIDFSIPNLFRRL
ncbi:hypothetical protein BOTCAL_0113g00250 [Botryotinia calthae]|uniref:Uncharacterized protein n=1 Tax=Botryotinia calthae TaxID=38488 RepID=A0A4Y8D592_9HELO|nr:hypothetical protein BOTCAL_0113g00250 [Botryotinia calthae]